VATIVRDLTGRGRIEGEATTPKNQIATSKLEALGMRFGGRPLLEQTIQEILATITK